MREQGEGAAWTRPSATRAPRAAAYDRARLRRSRVRVSSGSRTTSAIRPQIGHRVIIGVRQGAAGRGGSAPEHWVAGRRWWCENARERRRGTGAAHLDEAKTAAWTGTHDADDPIQEALCTARHGSQ